MPPRVGTLTTSTDSFRPTAIWRAFYSWRLLFLTFHGQPRADEKTMSHVHESPPIMTIPLGVLALGAVVSGGLAYGTFVGDGMAAFWGKSILVLADNNSIEKAHHVELWVKLLPTVVGLVGIALAWQFYVRRPKLPGIVVENFGGIHQFLYNKWYFDELYDLLFVRPAHWIGRALWKGGDGAVIDGLGPDGISAVTRDIAGRASRLQSGYVYHYAFAMLIGVAALVSWYVYVRVGG